MKPMRTVIVLGAGASKPYGFPDGIELKQIIAKTIAAQSPTLKMCGFDDGHFAQFRKILMFGGFDTLDYMLEKKTDFRKLGAYAIAITMLPLENMFTLFNGTHDWYFKLFQLLDFESEDPDASWLTIVTLNYERSLECYLTEIIDMRCPPEKIEAAHKKRKSIDIIHAHGSLGEYPTVPYGLEDEPHANSVMGPDYLPINIDLVKSAGERLRLVADDFENEKEFSKAQNAVEKAERIVFIGFGYDKRTVTRLFRDKVPKDKQIVGTCWIPNGVSQSESDRIKTLFGGKIELIQKNATEFIDVLDFHPPSGPPSNRKSP